MANTSYGSSLPSTAISEVRQRQRDRRRQEQEASKASEDMPSFPEPLRVARQDSLSTAINDVLGDPNAVSTVIKQNPTSWFGTSRNSSSHHTSSGGSSHRQHSGGEKSKQRHEGSGGHRSSGGGTHQAHGRSQPYHSSQQRGETRHSGTSYSKGGGAYQGTNSSSQRHQQSDTAARAQETSASSSLKGADSLLNNDDRFSPSPLPTSNFLDQVSNRGRLQSADMPGAVEHIFQEMKHLVQEPLTAIQTPNVGSEFSFPKGEGKLKGEDTEDALGGGVEQALHSASIADGGLSDSDSSEEEEESESEESEADEPDQNKWHLGSYMEVPPQEEARAGPAEAHGPSGGSKKTRSGSGARTEHGSGFGDSRSHSSQSAQRKSSNRGRPSTKSSNSLTSGGNAETKTSSAATTKGKTSDKRSNHSKSSSRGRHSSASSHRSASPAPRTTQPPPQRVAAAQGPKRTKDSPLLARSDARNPKKASPTPPKGSPADSGAKDPTKSKYKGRERADRGPYSWNSNSNNDTSPNVRNVTVSNTHQSSGHRRTGNKGPSYSFNRAPEKKCAVERPTHSAASSSESSDDEEDRLSASSDSSSSDSEAEEKPVFSVAATSPASIPRTAKSAPRERTESSSSKAKYPKLNVAQPSYSSPSPAKKPTAPEVKSRRSAPGSIPRQEHAAFQASQNFQKQDPIAKDKTEHSAKTSYGSSPAESEQRQHKSKHKSSKQSASFQSAFPSLWVRLKPDSAGQSKRDDRFSPAGGGGDARTKGAEYGRFSDVRGSATAMDGSGDGRFSRVPTLSTGSETEQPIRRAESVQVAVAVSSNDVSPGGQNLHSKRKHGQSSSNYPDGQPSGPGSHKSKRRKRESESLAEIKTSQQPMGSQGESGKQSCDENSQWKDRRKTSPSSQYHQHNRSYRGEKSSSSSQQSLASSQQRTNNDSCQSTSHSASAGVASIVSEPDSSWPEQERLLKSDDYMREGKRLKHEGDACTDTRTGRTRTGESLSRALIYFEAALCFVMNGYMLELENGSERSETSSQQGSSHSPTSMYHQTISLLDYIKKMRPHDDQQETAFKRLNLSCLRCQALLHLRVYKLKKDLATKYSEIIADQFKQTASKASRTPSPWHPNATSANGQNVVSPVSPAVPSPYGVTLPGPSPVAGNPNDYVSSSTQVGSRITSPPNQNSVVFPPKSYEVFKHYHTIMSSLMQAHEKWEQAEALQAEHADFFRNVDTLCGRSLMLHSSLRDMATYNKVVLHQLRAVYLQSPRE